MLVQLCAVEYCRRRAVWHYMGQNGSGPQIRSKIHILDRNRKATNSFDDEHSLLSQISHDLEGPKCGTCPPSRRTTAPHSKVSCSESSDCCTLYEASRND